MSRKEQSNNLRHRIKEPLPDNIDSAYVNKLNNKYNDPDLVDMILDESAERKVKIDKLASKFVRKFYNQYDKGMSIHSITKRLIRYKSKYNLSDDVFNSAKRQFEKHLYKNMNETERLKYNNTNIGRSLGNPFIEVNDGIQTQDTDDYMYIQTIIRNKNMTLSKYHNILVQSLNYKMENVKDLHSEKGRTRINEQVKTYGGSNQSVHPVLVALFLNKYDTIDERMLQTNIAGVVSDRYNKVPIVTKQNYELLYNLVNDPADVVCSNMSPLKDLLDRTIVQIQLWDNISVLRDGRFTTNTRNDFLTAIDVCKVSNYDNPNFIIVGEEGIILRRLMNVFAFRPILVQVVPIYSNNLTSPYNTTVLSTMITSIPFVTYRLNVMPKLLMAISNNQLNERRLLTDNQFIQFFVENNSIIEKITSVKDVSGPLIYYVPRRAVFIPINNTPLYTSSLPLLPNVEISNETVIFPHVTEKIIKDKVLFLTSGVLLDVKEINGRNVCIGSTSYNFSIAEYCCNSYYLDIVSDDVLSYDVNTDDVLLARKNFNSYLLYSDNRDEKLYVNPSILYKTYAQQGTIFIYNNINVIEEGNKENFLGTMVEKQQTPHLQRKLNEFIDDLRYLKSKNVQKCLRNLFCMCVDYCINNKILVKPNNEIGEFEQAFKIIINGINHNALVFDLQNVSYPYSRLAFLNSFGYAPVLNGVEFIQSSYRAYITVDKQVIFQLIVLEEQKYLRKNPGSLLQNIQLYDLFNSDDEELYMLKVLVTLGILCNPLRLIM